MAGEKWVGKMHEESQDFIVAVLRMTFAHTDLCIYVYCKFVYSKFPTPLHDYRMEYAGCMRKPTEI